MNMYAIVLHSAFSLNKAFFSNELYSFCTYMALFLYEVLATCDTPIKEYPYEIPALQYSYEVHILQKARKYMALLT